MLARQSRGSRFAGAAAALVITLVATLAAAAPARLVRLQYVRGLDAADCPEIEVLRAGVAARLGYDPFQDGAEALIAATVARTGRALEASIEMKNADGKVLAERKLTSRRSDCAELASAVELAISIAIDPLGMSRPNPPPAVAAPLPPAAPTTAAPAPSSPIVIAREPAPVAVARADASPPVSEAAPRPPTHFEASLGALGALGSAPAVALGGTLEASARRGALSLGIEGRADLPARESLSSGQVGTSLLMGSFVPCLHHGPLGGCFLASAGALRASGHDLVDARATTIPFFAIGARLLLDLPVGELLAIRLHADLVAPLTETVVRVSGQDVWTSPSISGALGIGVKMSFP